MREGYSLERGCALGGPDIGGFGVRGDQTTSTRLSLSPSAECRLPESVHFAESDVILGVVRARSVHKVVSAVSTHETDWAG